MCAPHPTAVHPALPPTVPTLPGPALRTQGWEAAAAALAHSAQPWRFHLDRIPLLRLGGKQRGHHQIVLLSDKPAYFPGAAPPSALAVFCRNVWHKKDPSLMGPSCLKVSPVI